MAVLGLVCIIDSCINLFWLKCSIYSRVLWQSSCTLWNIWQLSYQIDAMLYIVRVVSVYIHDMYHCNGFQYSSCPVMCGNNKANIHFLQVKAANRKSQLDNAYLLQTFLADSRDLVSLGAGEGRG